jgi:hypothetical protein
MVVDIFNKVSNECIGFAREKGYRIIITENLITIDGIKSMIGNEEVFNKFEDIMYFLINENKNSNCEKYLIENNEKEVSLKLYPRK